MCFGLQCNRHKCNLIFDAFTKVNVMFNFACFLAIVFTQFVLMKCRVLLNLVFSIFIKIRCQRNKKCYWPFCHVLSNWYKRIFRVQWFVMSKHLNNCWLEHVILRLKSILSVHVLAYYSTIYTIGNVLRKSHISASLIQTFSMCLYTNSRRTMFVVDTWSAYYPDQS